MSCTWLFIGRREGGWLADAPKDYVESYVTSFYFITQTITKVGYGDYSPMNWIESSFLGMLMFSSIFWFTLLQNRVETMQIVKSLQTYMHEKGVEVTFFLHKVDKTLKNK